MSRAMSFGRNLTFSRDPATSRTTSGAEAPHSPKCPGKYQPQPTDVLVHLARRLLNYLSLASQRVYGTSRPFHDPT